MKKQYFIICGIIMAVFSSIMIPLFSVNRYKVNNSMGYYSDNIQMVGYEAWFEFYDLNENLPENLKIVVDVHVVEYENNEICNEFNSKIEFDEFRENRIEHYYTAEHFFSVLTSSSYEMEITNVEYAKNGVSFRKMDKADLFDIDMDKLVAEHKNRQTMDTIYMFILIVGYISLTLVIVMPFVMKGFKSLMKRMYKFNIGLSKEILSENKEDMTDIMSTAVEIKSDVIAKNKDILSTIETQQAEIMSDAMTKTAKALKKGFKQEEQCKYCGAKIDAHSKFCNNCGKEQK